MQTRLVMLLVLFAGFAGAQESMTVEVIDFYGLRTVSEEAVRAQLPFNEGTVLTPETGFDEAGKEREMATALGVARVELTPVCCPTPGTLVIYVGLQELADQSLTFRAAPDGIIDLPPSLLELAARLEEASVKGIRAGMAGDDFTRACRESHRIDAEVHRATG